MSARPWTSNPAVLKSYWLTEKLLAHWKLTDFFTYRKICNNKICFIKKNIYLSSLLRRRFIMVLANPVISNSPDDVIWYSKLLMLDAFRSKLLHLDYIGSFSSQPQDYFAFVWSSFGFCESLKLQNKQPVSECRCDWHLL